MTTAPDVESASADYAARFAGPVGQWFLDVQAAATRRLLMGLPPGSRALDVGGGHGQLVPVLAAAGCSVTVIGSVPAAGAGIARYVEQGIARFDVGSLDVLPYEPASFDVVCSYRLLAHVTDWRAFLSELCRVARRAVLVDYASRRSINIASAAFFGMKRRVEGNTRPFQLIAPADIDRTFAAAGFEVTGSIPQFAWPMALHRALPVGVARALESLPRAIGLTRLAGSPVIARADRRPAPRA
jgi:2-polyprenyl-3-methyl-5-hydroxy-6-metoxy-1,4-benzoquinol methylase